MAIKAARDLSQQAINEARKACAGDQTRKVIVITIGMSHNTFSIIDSMISHNWC
jgi:hypothetical protein